MNVLIVDDHPMVRDALAQTVQALADHVEVCQAADYVGLMGALTRTGFDLALLDLQIPGMDGVAGVQRIRTAAPMLPLVVVSGQEDGDTIRAVLAAGAAGFVPKTSSASVMVGALRLVLAGGVFVPQQLLAAVPAATRSAGSGLTPRQLDVLHGLLKGLPNKLIARELGLTEGTVKIHIAAILRVLQARNRTDAVLRARAAGLADG
jgi:DNA-binding NarL/FixJ family response regulator